MPFLFRTLRIFRKPSKVFFVPFLTTMELVVPLENDPILSGRSIRSFRHLELQNPSIRLLEIHCAPFLCSVPPFWNCCTILDLCLKSEIINGFWSSRCLNDHIDVPDKIGSFSSGATTSMVVKNGTKKTFEGFFSKCLKYFICSKHVSQKWL